MLSCPFWGVQDTDRLARPHLFNDAGERFELVLPARLSVEDFEMRKDPALAGLGFTVLALMHCETELANGELVA